LSSGLPPAGIAVVRISGPQAGMALASLAGRLPKSRRATFSELRGANGLLDEALILWLPGPATATGEDLAELHLHGGRAVVGAVLAELGGFPGLRPAVAGEFTRRAFENGRIDLAQAEGLADLLAAETESQRASAVLLAGGALGLEVGAWQRELLRISAQVEAVLDFSDEDDVPETSERAVRDVIGALEATIAARLATPPAERLRDGVMVVLGGPPNSGKSSLINRLVEREVAIVTPQAGTTRDRIEVPVAIDGVPLLLTDTAGLRGDTGDAVETIGIARAREALVEADIILWLGDAAETPEGAILIAAKSDLRESRDGLPVSARTGEGVAALTSELVMRAKALLPKQGEVALNRRHHAILHDVQSELSAAYTAGDLLVVAEYLRTARTALDRLTGRAGVEDMLDTLFGGFCIGK
jgi:tRNA modification GTPase